jgi:hypothetical protein
MPIPVPFFIGSLLLSPSRSIAAAAYTRCDGTRRRRTTGCATAAKRKGRGGPARLERRRGADLDHMQLQLLLQL